MVLIYSLGHSENIVIVGHHFDFLHKPMIFTKFESDHRQTMAAKSYGFRVDKKKLFV